MKTLKTLLFLLLMSISSAYAIDQQSLQELQKLGFEVRMGELTGAGGKMSLVRVAGFIHPKGVIMKGECSSIVVSPTQGEPKVSDITKVKVNETVISAQELEGFFIHKQ